MLTKQKIKTAELPQTEPAYETPLLTKLKDIRRELAAKENLASYIVLSDATLVELATYLPHNLDELSRISGFGEVKIEKYGHEFLEGVTEYCREHTLTSRIHLKAPKKQHNSRPERENETKQQTLSLFRQGNSIEQIAVARKLSPATVEGHLAFYVQQGSIPVEQLIDVSRIPVIQGAIEQIGGKMLTPIKEFLGEDFSYNEIRLVMAYIESRKLQEVFDSSKA